MREVIDMENNNLYYIYFSEESTISCSPECVKINGSEVSFDNDEQPNHEE